MGSIDAIADWLSQPLILFILVLTRLSVMIMAMPAVGTGVPLRVRAILAIALTMLLMPLIPPSTPWAGSTLIELIITAAREAMIGMLIGFVVRLLITGMQLAGEMASNGGGMQLGESMDPELRMNVSTMGRLVSLMVTAAFLIFGGHRMMFEALLDSFRAMPPGEVRFDVGMMELVTFELSAGIEAGIRAGAPIIMALLLSNLVTGLISRTLPQLNLLAIGLPINGVVLLLVSSLSLGYGIWVFQDAMLKAMGHLAQLW